MRIAPANIQQTSVLQDNVLLQDGSLLIGLESQAHMLIKHGVHGHESAPLNTSQCYCIRFTGGAAESTLCEEDITVNSKWAWYI